MSLDENSKEESDVAQKQHEPESKQSKDRKSRKEKIKPPAKVKRFSQSIFFFCRNNVSELKLMTNEWIFRL